MTTPFIYTNTRLWSHILLNTVCSSHASWPALAISLYTYPCIHILYIVSYMCTCTQSHSTISNAPAIHFFTPFSCTSHASPLFNCTSHTFFQKKIKSPPFRWCPAFLAKTLGEDDMLLQKNPAKKNCRKLTNFRRSSVFGHTRDSLETMQLLRMTIPAWRGESTPQKDDQY